MSYIWEFTVGTIPVAPTGRKCHRGPLVDIEIVMAKPFTVMSGIESLRMLVLEHVVDSTYVPVRTRECILRVLNSNVGPLFTTVNPRYGDLDTYVCEKRNSLTIDRELSHFNMQFEAGIRSLELYGVNDSNIEVLLSALQSNSPILRVAARCSLILAATLVEMR